MGNTVRPSQLSALMLHAHRRPPCSINSSWYRSATFCSDPIVLPLTRNANPPAQLLSPLFLAPCCHSSSACAFVPLNPNELTPATLRSSRHSTASCGTTHRISSISDTPIKSFKCRKCKCFAMAPFSMHSTALSTPKTPAAVSVCPKFVLALPITSGSRAPRLPSASDTACTSIGSPSDVPVPCASNMLTSLPSSCALSSASLINRTCDGPFGAVSPLLRPSWFTA